MLLSVNSYPKDIVWDAEKDVINIGRSVSILEDKNGEFSIEEVSSGVYDKSFVQSEQKILDFGYTESVYWLRFSFQNNTNEELLFEIAHAFLPVADLFYFGNEDELRKLEAGYLIPMNKKIINHHYQVFPLPKGAKQFYVRLLSNSHPLPLKIWNKSAYDISTYRYRIVYGFYIGFMFFVIISNIFFFFSLRNRLYLFYALVVLIYASYSAMVMDGYILYFFPKVDLMFWYTTIPTIGVVVQTAYCLAFLSVNKYAPRLNRIIVGVIMYFSLYAFMKFLIPLIAVLFLNTIHALISFFIMGFVGVKVGANGNKMGYYFALAYIVYFLLVLTEAIYIQFGYPAYLVGLSHVTIATLIEAFVLSYLLTKRFEWEKTDIEKARLAAQVKLFNIIKEKERIVKNQNKELELKVAKRTKILKSLNDKLEVANTTKDKFFSIIAHDLKSPLSSLLGISKLLFGDFDVLSRKDQLKYIDLLNIGLLNTYRLLDNLLCWSKSQRGKIEFSPEKIDLHMVTDEILRFLNQQILKKALTVINEIPEQVYIDADNNMVLTILRNLISNAVKFTEYRGTIKITVDICSKEKQKFAVINVEDNGIGISPDAQSKLFCITENVTTKGTENETGTGLGLILCKEFIERHGGRIWVESNEGYGSKFYFTLPVASKMVKAH